MRDKDVAYTYDGLLLSHTGLSGLLEVLGWDSGVVRCKLLHLKWINKLLLYGTGKYIQSPGIIHNEKEYFKKCIYV